MRCIVCRHGETELSTTTATFSSRGSTIVVTLTPADVCENCGEPYVVESVVEQLLGIVDAARKSSARVLVRDFAPPA